MKRLTKVTLTAEIYVTDIRPEKAERKIEKKFFDKVIAVPYIPYATYKVTATEVDPDMGE
jgi:hypothetical protein